jgi:hypothetical protein
LWLEGAIVLMIKVEDGGEVSDLWVVGDLRTLLFAGGQGLANSTFSHVGGLPDLFMEHDVGALQGQENQNLSIDSGYKLILPFVQTIFH